MEDWVVSVLFIAGFLVIVFLFSLLPGPKKKYKVKDPRKKYLKRNT
jgi:hypothetical protein